MFPDFLWCSVFFQDGFPLPRPRAFNSLPDYVQDVSQVAKNVSNTANVMLTFKCLLLKLEYVIYMHVRKKPPGCLFQYKKLTLFCKGSILL